MEQTINNYSFEYTHQKLIYILSVLSLAVTTVFVFIAINVAEVIPRALLVILGAVLPIVILTVFRKRIQRSAIARFSDSVVEFAMENIVTIIQFSDILNYRVDRSGGARLRINCSNGKTLVIQANPVFCDASGLRLFCDVLEPVLMKNLSDGTRDKVQKVNSKVATWMLVLLICMTLALIGTFALIFYKDLQIPSALYTLVAVVLFMWYGYWSAKK